MSCKLKIILVVLFFASCKVDNPALDGKVEQYVINPSNYSEVCNASEWINVKVIKLQTNENDAYISESIDDFKVLSEKVIIFDRVNLMKISAFDFSGKYLWSISAQDEGYEFFSTIGTVEFYEDRFEVYDEQESVFYYYDYDGNYLGKNYIDMYFSDKILLKDNLFAFHTYERDNYHLAPSGKEESYSVFFVDSTGVIGKVLPYPSRINQMIGYDTYRNFSKYKGKVYYHRSFTDTVYTFEALQAIPSYAISFKGKHLGADFTTTYNGESFINYATTNEYPFIRHTFQSDKYLFSLYNHPQKGLAFSCLKKKQKKQQEITALCNATLLKVEDKLLPLPLTYNDGYFATLCSPYQYEVLQKVATLEQFPNQQQLNAIAESLGEESDDENPILILYTIKE